MGATGQQRTFGGQNFFRGGSPAATHDWSGISQIGDVSPQLTQQLAGIANGDMPTFSEGPLSAPGMGNSKGPISQNNGKPGINYSDAPVVGVQSGSPILSNAMNNPRSNSYVGPQIQIPTDKPYQLSSYGSTSGHYNPNARPQSFGAPAPFNNSPQTFYRTNTPNQNTIGAGGWWNMPSGGRFKV